MPVIPSPAAAGRGTPQALNRYRVRLRVHVISTPIFACVAQFAVGRSLAVVPPPKRFGAQEAARLAMTRSLYTSFRRRSETASLIARSKACDRKSGTGLLR